MKSEETNAEIVFSESFAVISYPEWANGIPSNGYRVALSPLSQRDAITRAAAGASHFSGTFF